jgi:chromosome segregation ATPase
VFIPMWLIFVVGASVIAYIWTLHSQRDSLREALGETNLELEECKQELEECQDELEDADDVDEETGRMNPY